ncbi:MAG: HAD family hydrolase, partial [Ktedonobacterales bacterium]|nr:HAD family hydrolase [Ktedonobacterales bacterium]
GQVVASVEALLATLAERTPALVLLHTFATPQYAPLGILDERDAFGQTALFAAINSGIAQRVRERFPTVYLVDEDRVFGRIGKAHVTDPRLWFLARLGWGEAALRALASEYLRYIQAAKGRTRKCLVLDLDNTLWGGVLGEDGPSGIALGHEAPGNAFLAFQEAVLALWRRGVILAINSKNDEAEALAVLERHPEMLLRRHHFAAMRINWRDKATNLRALSEELTIGLESMVFFDDHPTERALVRAQLPEVLTVELPPDPALYRATLLALTEFETLTLTAEDRERGRLYAERQERRAWAGTHAADLEAYLAELRLVVTVEAADEFAIPRIAQLLGKTNQFNLTTRRHSEAEVRAFVASPTATVYAARVRDRFGDSGLVGAAIVLRQGDIWEIESLLLSCRVLGCGVETALLATLATQAHAAGAHRLRGAFIPTARNEPARDFYGRQGFMHVSTNASGELWELDLREHVVVAPTWLTLRVEGETASPSAAVGAAQFIEGQQT